MHSQTTYKGEINTQEIVHDGTQVMLETNITIYSRSSPTKRNILLKLIYKKETQKIIDTTNNFLPKLYITTKTLQDIHVIIYAAAVTTIQYN